MELPARERTRNDLNGVDRGGMERTGLRWNGMERKGKDWRGMVLFLRRIMDWLQTLLIILTIFGTV